MYSQIKSLEYTRNIILPCVTVGPTTNSFTDFRLQIHANTLCTVITCAWAFGTSVGVIVIKKPVIKHCSENTIAHGVVLRRIAAAYS